ncbi:MAG: hypothetical protein KDB92_01525, partial [Chitinophagaceae bacterium]|nr:hypothetical protein [Chitinophagaceae bacterium]
INSSDELPKISEVIADQLVEPTALEKLKSKQNGEEEQTEDDEDVPMAVSDDGELISSDNKNNEEK